MRGKDDRKRVAATKRTSTLARRKRTSRAKAKIVIDPISGFPAVTLGPGAPVLTHKEVKEMLADFP
jgi:hypothetical protein